MPKQIRRLTISGVAAAVALASLALTPTAQADEPDAFEAFVSAVPSLQNELDQDSAAALEATVGAESLISAENAPSSEVVATSPSGAEVVSHPDGVASTTIAREGGTVQALASFASADSPTEVTFEVDGTAYETDDGLVKVRSKAGEVYTAVPAWAKDANGRDVPTHYEVRDGKIVQVVEHDAEAFDYPIVADPFLFVTLFSRWSRTTDHGDYRYGGWVTPGGAVILSGGGGVGGYLAGQAAFRTAGWDEWKAKWPAVTNKPTLQQQYNCHVSGSVYVLWATQDYNLERYRTNRSNWVDGIQSHHCNWVP